MRLLLLLGGAHLAAARFKPTGQNSWQHLRDAVEDCLDEGTGDGDCTTLAGQDVPAGQGTGQYGHISNWDTSDITNMDNLFYIDTATTAQTQAQFNQPLYWDTSKVTSMFSTFRKAYAFNGDISSWDVSQVTNMDGFMYCNYPYGSFNQDISGWDVRKVQTMQYAFQGQNQFAIDLSGWNVLSTIALDAGTFPTNSAPTNFPVLCGVAWSEVTGSPQFNSQKCTTPPSATDCTGEVFCPEEGAHGGTCEATCDACVGKSYDNNGVCSATEVIECTGTQVGGAARKQEGGPETDDSCDPCAEGTWAADAAADCQAHLNISTCAASRQQAGTPTTDATCLQCAGATFGPADGSTDCQTHTSCGLQANNDPRLQGADAVSAGSCALCAAGTDGPDDGDCTQCQAGSFAANPGDPCEACTGGYSGAGATACTPHISCGLQVNDVPRLQGNDTVSAGDCASCTSGWALTGQADCQPHLNISACHADRQQAGTPTSDAACPQCGPGTWAADGSAACQPHTTCEASRLNPGTPTADASCASCPEGTFGPADGSAACQAHDTLPACTARKVPGTITEDASCPLCGAGTYGPEDGSEACLAQVTCSPGQKGTHGTSTTQENVCSACDDGQFQAAALYNGTTCTPYKACDDGFQIGQTDKEGDRQCGNNVSAFAAWNPPPDLTAKRLKMAYVLGGKSDTFREKISNGNFEDLPDGEVFQVLGALEAADSFSFDMEGGKKGYKKPSFQPGNHTEPADTSEYELTANSRQFRTYQAGKQTYIKYDGRLIVYTYGSPVSRRLNANNNPSAEDCFHTPIECENNGGTCEFKETVSAGCKVNTALPHTGVPCAPHHYCVSHGEEVPCPMNKQALQEGNNEAADCVDCPQGWGSLPGEACAEECAGFTGEADGFTCDGGVIGRDCTKVGQLYRAAGCCTSACSVDTQGCGCN